jgi:hypothetical protein
MRICLFAESQGSISLELATPDIVECFEVIAMAGGLRKGQKTAPLQAKDAAPAEKPATVRPQSLLQGLTHLQASGRQ